MSRDEFQEQMEELKEHRIATAKALVTRLFNDFHFLLDVSDRPSSQTAAILTLAAILALGQ